MLQPKVEQRSEETTINSQLLLEQSQGDKSIPSFTTKRPPSNIVKVLSSSRQSDPVRQLYSNRNDLSATL
jgi:hypothetical protein